MEGSQICEDLTTLLTFNLDALTVVRSLKWNGYVRITYFLIYLFTYSMEQSPS
jgi:hypothetical protein